MHQCKSIYIGKIVISNQVKIGSKSESIATLPCDVSNQERFVTIYIYIYIYEEDCGNEKKNVDIPCILLDLLTCVSLFIN